MNEQLYNLIVEALSDTLRRNAMTQEHYREAAETFETFFDQEMPYPSKEDLEIAAHVLRLLATTHVLVQKKPVAWQYWQPLGKLVLSTSPPTPEMLSRADVVITPLYAQEPST